MNHIGSPENDSWVFEKYIYFKERYARAIAYNLSRGKKPT